MSDGCVAQFGSPYELLCDTEGGILTELVEETGPASRDRLFEMARMAYFARINQESDNKGGIGNYSTTFIKVKDCL